jgi:uncharacterized protein (DUF2384 family)
LEITEKDFLNAKLVKSENDLIGSLDKFLNWLSIENSVMGGEKPVSYLSTFSGIQLIMDKLNGIEYGFSA